MNQESILATYLIETPYSLEFAANMIAGEQSTGTFLKLPNETVQIKEKHRAKVIKIKELETVTKPSLPGSKPPPNHDGKFRIGEITLAFPFHNIGASIPNLLATVAGNLFELEELSGLRLIDLILPVSFSEKYVGPKYGIKGTRKLTGVYDRPIIGTILKPNIGFNQEELRTIVRDLVMAGIDFIKDDEVNGNPPYFPLIERVNIVMDEIERAADKTGKKAMYACNITDDIENLQSNHDHVVKAGGNCVMISINSIGFSGLTYLNKFCEVPIHGHRNQWGMMTRHPMLGMEFNVYQKLCRLSGVDHLHVNGLDNKFYESNDSVRKSTKECLTPMFGGYEIMPVLSSKQWAGAAIKTYDELETVDVMNIAGGGIHAHPDGIVSGFKSMIQGWEAALTGVPLEKYAKNHIELKRAIETFSK